MTSPTGSGMPYLIAAVLAAIALVLGLWDAFIEADNQTRWVLQILFPAALFLLMLGFYLRSRKPD